MNGWWQPTGSLYGLTAQGLNTILRIEVREQGTPRCHGRTDKLFVGEILWVILAGRLLRFGIKVSIRLH